MTNGTANAVALSPGAFDTERTAPEDAPAAVLPHDAGIARRAGASLGGGTGITVLTLRSDFVRASNAWRAGTAGLNLQGRIRADHERDKAGPGIRAGFTCSKKVGNAVARNRAKRRLREIARLILPTEGQPGWDYVLIGKNTGTDARDFDALQKDLRIALARVHAQAPARPGTPAP